MAGRTRVNLTQATKTIVESLKERPYSVSELSRVTGLNRRTVEKSLKLIEEIQKLTEKRKVEISQVHPRRREIRAMPREVAMLSLPKELQKLIIRTAYFPLPSREEELLTHLLVTGVTTPAKAISLERAEPVRKLLNQGQLLETDDGRIFLSREGKIVAEGALELYPDYLLPPAPEILTTRGTQRPIPLTRRLEPVSGLTHETLISPEFVQELTRTVVTPQNLFTNEEVKPIQTINVGPITSRDSCTNPVV